MQTPTPDQVCDRIEQHDMTLAMQIRHSAFFVSKEQIPKLEAIDRFIQIMIRTNNGRFVCAVQNALHYINIIEASGFPKPGSDYVRDISLPC